MEIPDVIKGIIILIFVFVPIEKALAVHHQKLLREGWFTDLCYYFSGYFIGHGTTKLWLFWVHGDKHS